MRSRAVREGSVGLLILLGVGAVLAIMAWLRGVHFGGQYILAVELTDALGLNAGSPVKYRGVKVGRVRSLTPGVNGILAEVEIAPASLLIPRNSSVSVTQSGFIGQVELSIQPVQALSINTGTPMSPFKPDCDSSMILCDGDRLNASVGANFDELIRATTKLATVIGDTDLIENANNTLKTFSTTAQNISLLSRNANRTLRDVSGAANGFTDLSRDASQEIKHFGTAATSITTAASQVGHLGSRFGSAADHVSAAADQVTTLVQVNRSTLVSTLGNLEDASQELKIAVKSLNPIISRVESGKLLDNIEALAENGAKASASLKSLTTTVNNPATLLGLAQTLDSARVTFQNTQKITTDLEQVTGNPEFRQNLIKLINGLSKLVSSTQSLDQQLSVASQQPSSGPFSSLSSPSKPLQMLVPPTEELSALTRPFCLEPEHC